VGSRRAANHRLLTAAGRLAARAALRSSRLFHAAAAVAAVGAGAGAWSIEAPRLSATLCATQGGGGGRV